MPDSLHALFGGAVVVPLEVGHPGDGPIPPWLGGLPFSPPYSLVEPVSLPTPVGASPIWSSHKPIWTAQLSTSEAPGTNVSTLPVKEPDQ